LPGLFGTYGDEGMTEETILTMRAMAWERAKGELGCYLATYWPRWDAGGKKLDNGYEQARERIEAFIKDFEANCR